MFIIHNKVNIIVWVRNNITKCILCFAIDGEPGKRYSLIEARRPMTTDTGMWEFRRSADFRRFGSPQGCSWDQCKSGLKFRWENLGGVVSWDMNLSIIHYINMDFMWNVFFLLTEKIKLFYLLPTLPDISWKWVSLSVSVKTKLRNLAPDSLSLHNFWDKFSKKC